MSKALETVKLIELTLVVAIETYTPDNDHVCAMEYIKTEADAEVIGWSEQVLTVTPANKGDKQ